MKILMDLLDDLKKLFPVPVSFVQKEALEYIRKTTTDFEETQVCRQYLIDLAAGKEIDFPLEEVERTFYDLLQADSISQIWRKFKPAKDII